MSKLIKYISLIILGTGLILLIGHFEKENILKSVEYKFTYILKAGYTIVTGFLFFLIGLSAGYLLKLNPLLTGLCLILAFPAVAIYEASVYRGSHNLIPFEFITHFIFALPAIIGVYIGNFISKRYLKQNQTF